MFIRAGCLLGLIWHLVSCTCSDEGSLHVFLFRFDRNYSLLSGAKAEGYNFVHVLRSIRPEPLLSNH